ncbi:elongation of very long chain fatty acids protein 6-like [Coccinella septempunctata]|uniref:elongation of very long chain fatty acids protein 6-like n=1 Tax=Coccinella septempunctata TaxID=41139 RepID=UPI001D080E2A|nr:elongation of very long chain fatty acids protein 6-like [Coccinella septempunctata]
MEKSNDSFVFDFEAEFDEKKAHSWIKEHWTDTFYFNVVYLMVIFSLKKFMQNRPPYKMMIPAVIWNIFLASFSIIGTIRTFPELRRSLSFHGIHHSICDQSFIATDEVTRVWVYLFVLSKSWELLDTVFVVLRKHPLIFLHWYHHMIALVYSWVSYSELISTSRWFVIMNFFVHSLMYSYYALRCLKFKLPKQISMIITTLQILQMVIAFSVNIYAFYLIQQGIECGISIWNIRFSTVMYMSFFVLFSRFFYKAYLSNNKVEEKNVKGYDHLAATSKKSK